MRHFYPITVVAVGRGAIRGSDGKTLTCIGSMPVQVGDTVYTDGRVVYGHAPIKASGAIINKQDYLVPIYVQSASWWGWDYLGAAAGYTKTGSLRTQNSALDYNLGWTQNWCYTYRNKFYRGDYDAEQEGLHDYIDMVRENNVVYTAEFTGDNAPLFGRNCTPIASRNYRELRCTALNFYYLENNSGGFNISFINGGAVHENPIIAIKRNGEVIKNITLGNYQYALDLLKEIYLAYDDSGENIKRYHWKGDLTDGGNIVNHNVTLDIWVSHFVTQLLHFAFVGNGEWEMTVMSICEGAVEPHTIDVEYNQETEEYEDVYSVYSISCPVIMLICRIKSDGTQTVLQQRTVINSLDNNGVVNEAWANAASYPVENVNYVNEPYFVINYGDCALTTDMRRLGDIIDKNGDIISLNAVNMGCEELCMTNPAGKAAAGAVGSYIIYNLWLGTSRIIDTATYFGFSSGGVYAPLYRLDINQIVMSTKGTSLIERLSIYYFDGGNKLLCLRNACLWYLNRMHNEIEEVGYYPANLNLEMVRVSRQAEILDMPDLIDAVSNQDT